MTRNPYFILFRRFWYIIVAGAVIGAAAGYGLSHIATKVYTATSSMYFSLSAGATGNDINQGSTYTQNQMLSFAQLATSPVVLQPVIDALNLDDTPATLAKAVTVSTPQNTVVLQLDVADPSADQAARIANSITSSLGTQVEQIAPKNVTGNPTVSVRIIQPAVAPDGPSAPNERLNILVGLGIGLLLAVIVLMLMEALGTRVDSEEKAVGIAKAPSLGTIRRRKRSLGDGLTMIEQPQSGDAEDFRQLRSNLEFVAVDVATPCIVVTSSIQGEGKSTVAANLAIALTEGDQRVLLIDADLRRPRIAHYTGLVGSVGLSTILAGKVSFDDAIQHWGDKGLSVLTAGRIPPNPSELLSSRAMSTVIEQAREEFDVIIIDTPPLYAVADAATLAPLADGTLLVVDRTQVRRNQLTAAAEGVRRSGGSVVGLVINRVSAGRRRHNYYYSDEAVAQRDEVAAAAHHHAHRGDGELVGDARSDANVEADAPKAPVASKAATAPTEASTGSENPAEAETESETDSEKLEAPTNVSSRD